MKIEVDVPDWVYRLFKTIDYQKNAVSWLMNPPHCQKCKSRLHVVSPIYKMGDGKDRLLVENFSRLCKSCLKDEIKKVEFTGEKQCDQCGGEKTLNSITSKFLNVHFCKGWWNGFHICKKCTLETIDGEVTTGVCSFDRGVNYFKGANQLFLKNGKVKLFHWF